MMTMVLTAMALLFAVGSTIALVGVTGNTTGSGSEPQWLRSLISKEVTHEVIDSAHGSQRYVHTCFALYVHLHRWQYWAPIL